MENFIDKLEEAREHFWSLRNPPRKQISSGEVEPYLPALSMALQLTKNTTDEESVKTTGRKPFFVIRDTAQLVLLKLKHPKTRQMFPNPEFNSDDMEQCYRVIDQVIREINQTLN